MKLPSRRRYLFLLGLAAFASTIRAQTPGTFTATGSMTTARVFHTATLLLDGRVLIAGGEDESVFPPLIKASAELYDPATRTFTPTGSMTTARSHHSSLLLPDGRVLIVGGTAELYDPSTGTFTAIGNTSQHGFTTTLLTNGKVLITGRADAELYDPLTGAFAPAGPYAGSLDGADGYSSTSTLLPDGRVLFAAADQLYDPGAGTFSPAGGTGGYYGRTATLLTNGKVLFVGGEDYDPGNRPNPVLYDPSTRTFTATGNTIFGRSGQTATLLPAGTVLVAGSLTYANSFGTSETYDPARGAFAITDNLVNTRFFHTATLLSDGTVLLAGGYPGLVGFGNVGSNVGTASAEIYTPPTPKAAPVLLSLSGDGKGQGAIQHAGTVRIASATDPAVAGEYLSIYLTGLADGSVIPPQVAIGGRLAEITFFGNVPGYPGLNVINVRMPGDVASGPAVPVRLTYLSRPSNEVTIGVR